MGALFLKGSWRHWRRWYRAPGTWSFRIRSLRIRTWSRDLDILGASGFVSLFPFFITSEGYRRFVRRLVEPPPELGVVQARQQRVMFLGAIAGVAACAIATVIDIGGRGQYRGTADTGSKGAFHSSSAWTLYSISIILAIQIVLVLAFPLGVKWLATWP